MGLRRAEALRARIRGAMMLHYLQEHVQGKRDMSRTQVAAAIALLKKVCPDMTEIRASVQTETVPHLEPAQALYDKLRGQDDLVTVERKNQKALPAPEPTVQ